MSEGTMEKAWREYRAAVVPSDACRSQVVQTKQAFMAGGAVLLNEINPNNFENEDEFGVFMNDVVSEFEFYSTVTIAEEYAELEKEGTEH